MTEISSETPHTVIVGGGFAGVAAAKRLAKRGLPVTLVDRNTYHQFQPLLYQVATAQLSPEDVMSPLREIFRKQESVAVKNAEVVSIDPRSHSVTTAEGQTIAGDRLVLAIGAQPNDFGIPGVADHCYALYTAIDAIRLRDRILQVFEDADNDPSRIDKGALNFVIVGGGPTGVETAGALADLINDVMPEHYHDLDVDRARVILADVGDVVLRPFSAEAHEYAASALRKKGVSLRFGQAVTEVRDDRVLFGDGSEILTHCVVWAGGLKPRDLEGMGDLPKGPHGRIAVEEDLSVAGFPGVYAVGDGAAIPGPEGRPLPQLGAVAAQAGDAVAATILAEIDGDRTPAFRYRDRGIMAMIGRQAAVAEVGSKHHELHGVVAHSAWLGVHAWLLGTTRARIDAFVAWMWDAFSHSRSPAIIDDPDLPRIDWGDDSESR